MPRKKALTTKISVERTLQRPAQQPIDTDDLLADRGKTHGSFALNAMYSQNIKEVIRSSRNYPYLPNVTKESLDLIATKLSRLLSGDHTFDEHLDDMEGYIKLARYHNKAMANLHEAEK